MLKARISWVLYWDVSTPPQQHILDVYHQVTPVYQMLSTIDWYQYLGLWESLSPGMRRVAELVGVSEGFLARCVRGKVAGRTAAQQRVLAVHQRFYTTLVLQDLVQEKPLPVVADKFKYVTRGMITFSF